MGLSDNNITIKSEVYGHNVKNSTLYLGIQKNNKDFVHLTIHLTSQSLDSKKNGMIHFYKDIYNRIHPTISKKDVYALIFVKSVKNTSLHFSIQYGYDTSNITVPESLIYDSEIQQEMNSITTVLNRIFDEDDDYYIQYIIQPIRCYQILIHIRRHILEKQKVIEVFQRIVQNRRLL
jgi:hypothetical protein